jgi:pimeloyl-ACP methyl ester carboxylesterase
MAHKYQSLLVDGRAVEFRAIPGDLNLPVLVLLHEGLGCVSLWRDFPDQLSEATDHPIFVYSRFGYGGSAPAPLPWPTDYMQREGIEVLPKLLTAAGIEDCVLVGHSDGASIALANAGAVQDDRVRGLILMAPHVFAEECGLNSIREIGQQYAAGLRERLAKYHGDNVDCAFRGWSESWTSPAFAEWNLEALLPAIDVPLLQIQGVDDQYGTLAQLRAIAAGVSGPCQTEVLERCRHAPQFEQTERTLSLMADFLDAHDL